MKVLCLVFLFCLLNVDAQRRPSKTDASSETETAPRPITRGRSRFVSTIDNTQIEEQKRPETPIKRVSARRRPDSTTSKKNYEVEEIIDETPSDSLRRPGKTRVLTETNYEAHNAPPTALFQPSTTESLEDIIQSIGSDLADSPTTPLVPSTSSSETPSELLSSSSEITKTEKEARRETTRRQPESSTASITRSDRRDSLRRASSRTRTAEKPEVTTASNSRVRTRTRATRAPETDTASSSTTVRNAPVQRGSRRRPEVVTRGPSILGAAEAAELPSRSRTGRRIPTNNNKIEASKSPEKITIEIPSSRTTARKRVPEAATTESSRSTRGRFRSRSRVTAPIIDEQKLEVLPLFEGETKAVRTPITRRRNFNSADDIETSATENQIHVQKINEIAPISEKKSVVVETRTESSFKRRKIIKPTIKESVVTKVSEVTSKQTIIRKSKLPSTEVRDRGRKQVNANLAKARKSKDLTRSEEEIDESDNYPPQFKALLHAKKNKESRPSEQHPTKVTKAIEKIVTSSPRSTIEPSSEGNQIEELDNEVDPTTSTLRPTRRKFTPVIKVTEKPTRGTLPTRRHVIRSTVSPARDHRFHAKFNTPQEDATSTPVKAKGFSPKPPRGLYSSKKNKESHSFSKSNKTSTVQVAAIPKKNNRFSARYRNDLSSRSTLRASTSAPAYLPTIPSITPPTTVKSSIEDKDLGVEIITFDDPVHTVPSANLVSGEFLASSTESNHLTSPLVSEAQTKSQEKPVSIIESIINSITAISTTEMPDKTKLTTPTQEPFTRQTSILKLAKKPTPTDKTTQKIPVVPVTTEKPTTIIERILNSLSAIQSENQTNEITLNSKQVGTNFNTLSSPSTTPISRVAKSTLSAQSSTSVNPLSVFDEISNEQTLQKRTIGKLLDLLNGLTSTTSSSQSSELVVVTPKPSSFVTTLETITTTTPSTLTTTQLFTSPTTSSEAGNTESTINTVNTTPTIRYTTTPTAVTTTEQTTTTTGAPSTVTESTDSSTKDLNNDIGLLPLFVDPSVTSQVTETTPTFTSITTTDVADTETVFTFPSTLPTHINFDVSPGSVSIFSANDLSNAITTDDFSTITISSRTNLNDNTATTESSTVSGTTESTTVPESSTASKVKSPITTSTTGSTDSSTDASTNNNTESTTNSSSESSTNSSTESSTNSSTESSTNSGTERNANNSTENSSNTGTDSSTNPPDISTSPSNTTDISSNLIDSTTSSVKSNQTTNSSTNANRSGRLLNIVQDPVQNSIETTTIRDKDYYIFAVLNNNTILRKRPSRFPNKDTPFLVVGVYPNSTIVRKFPNGTIVPMEPVVRVDQNTIPPFDVNTAGTATTTSESTTESIDKNTVSSIEANPLSISSSSTESTSTTQLSSTSSISPSSSTSAPTTTVTLPSLSEILNGRTVKAFNSIINISDLTKTQTLEVDSKNESTTTPSISNRILDSSTVTTDSPTTISQPTVGNWITTYTPTTDFPATTFFPSFFTTFLSTIAPKIITTTLTPTTIQDLSTTTSAPKTTTVATTPPTTTTVAPKTTTPTIPPPTTTVTTTATPKTTTVEATTIPVATTTVPVPTTTAPVPTTTKRLVEVRSRGGDLVSSTTKRSISITAAPKNIIEIVTPRVTTIKPLEIASTVKPRILTEQQKKDLEMLTQLEREQAAILKQLSFLANLNLGQAKPKTTTEKSKLANRIIALAVERQDKQTITTPPTTTSTNAPRQAKKISTSDPSIEELVKQLNIVTPASVSSSFGKSNDAIIAALLKEQGIGPTTPLALEDIYSQTTTTRKPKTTTRAPGPLMQSLSWLLNALAPPTTRKPKAKPKAKPKPRPNEDQDDLVYQPTHITPVVTAAPNVANSLSQDDVKKLIKQLETIQKDPSGSKSIDLSSIKSLQSLINSDEVHVSSPGSTGSTLRSVTEEIKPIYNRGRSIKSTSPIPLSVSNSVEDDEEFITTTTAKPRISLPPVKLKPVPGVSEESGNMVRGQLVTAAVNVTRALSSFLGTALQDAAHQFTRLFWNGSGSVRDSISSGSVFSSIANLSAGSPSE